MNEIIDTLDNIAACAKRNNLEFKEVLDGFICLKNIQIIQKTRMPIIINPEQVMKAQKSIMDANPSQYSIRECHQCKTQKELNREWNGNFICESCFEIERGLKISGSFHIVNQEKMVLLPKLCDYCQKPCKFPFYTEGTKIICSFCIENKVFKAPICQKCKKPRSNFWTGIDECDCGKIECSRCGLNFIKELAQHIIPDDSKTSLICPFCVREIEEEKTN
jgi:hypothetical protein